MRRDPNQKKRQCTAGPEPALKQTRLVLATVPSAPVVTQTKFDSLLTDLIVKGMLPLTFVEQPEFVAFVKGAFLWPSAWLVYFSYCRVIMSSYFSFVWHISVIVD